MRFLADMGVSIRVVDWLRTGGHDAVHLREQGLQTMPKGDNFNKAASEQRISWSITSLESQIALVPRNCPQYSVASTPWRMGSSGSLTIRSGRNILPKDHPNQEGMP